MTEGKKKVSLHTRAKATNPDRLFGDKLSDRSIDLEPGNQPPRDLFYAKTLLHFYSLVRSLIISFMWLFALLLLVTGGIIYVFEKKFTGKMYPHVTVNGMPFGSKTEAETLNYWRRQNDKYLVKLYEFRHEDLVATASGDDLGIAYNAELAARQAFLVGRSGSLISDMLAKFFGQGTNVTATLRWDQEAADELLAPLYDALYVPVQEALFEFSDGKVTAFKPSGAGRQMDIDQTKKQFASILSTVPEITEPVIIISLVVKIIKPTISTDQANNFGIRELIGKGYSEYQGSIPGRKQNVALAASKLHGVLIKPGEVFSFNNTLGDVSASTGFQPAYIIKAGRTVLGDGGGVCQVSTTLFRAALNTGLPIIERQAHAYRVHYYEEAGFKAGLDATVFSPSVDLKIKNDTPGYILIQTNIDETVPSLTFELYGTGDGRKTEILDHKVWGITSPPPPLYQDDPTLQLGVVKQVDFSAWGAKASFQYKVTAEDGRVLQDQVFYSNFRPWQAVFLKGTKTP